MFEGGGHWLAVRRNDQRAYGLYRKHYSRVKNEKWRRWGNGNIMGPGEPMVLLTEDCSALFGWLRNTVGRYDGQVGVCCTVFRNEGGVLSSELIQEADELAWGKWPGERHFTYVEGGAVRSTNPGYCFLMAGWRRAGVSSKRGLVLLERLAS